MLYLVDGHDGAEDMWNAIVRAGATPIGLDAIEMLRVEAGLTTPRRTPGRARRTRTTLHNCAPEV
ncbi:MAG: hypothetical protein WD556_12370 [Actinomycetota bacterium]